MLKITVIGNLTNDVELRRSEATGKPYAILRLASDRRYRDREGNKLTDFISVKVRGPLAERCAAYISFAEEPERQPGFLVKGTEVEFLSPRRTEEAAEAMPDTEAA